MKPTVKYLLNGEYHYATVKDVGDIDSLRTRVKTDLVAAINDLISGGTKIADYEGLNKSISEIDKNLEKIRLEIGDGGLNDSQREQIRDILKEIPKIDYEAIAREMDEKINKAKEEIAKTSAEIRLEVEETKREIGQTEESLKKTKDELGKIDLNVKEVDLKYDELTGELKKKISSTDFELLETKVGKNENTLIETAKGLERTIKRDEWDLSQDRVAELENKVEETAEGVKRSITKDEMREQLALIDTYRPNMIMGTLDWSGWIRRGSVASSITSETYQHCTVLAAKNGSTYQTSTDELNQGETYIVSIWAKVSKGAKSRVSATITDGSKQTRNEILDIDGNTDVSESWRRYSTKIVSPLEGKATIFFSAEGITGADSPTLFLAGAKLENGQSATGWNIHPKDNTESVTKLSHTVEETAKGLKSITEKLVKTDEGIEKNTHEIESLADLQRDSIKKVTELGEESKRMSNVLERTAEEMSSKITMENVTEIFDGMENSTKNLISNGNFFNGTTGWTAGKEWTVVGKAGKDYLYTSRTGLTSDLDLAVFSEYVSVQKGEKISFGLDMYIDNLSAYDRKIPVRVELYDKNNTRVDYKNYELKDLIPTPATGYNTRLGGTCVVDRDDVFKARLRLSLQRNGGIGFTDISLRIGAITDKSWTPSPGDNGVITAKLETGLNQKADSIDLSAVRKDVDKANKAITDSEAKWTIEAGKISQSVKSVEEKAIKDVAGLTKSVGDAQDKAVALSREYTDSEIQATSKKITLGVEKVEEKVTKVATDFANLDIGGNNMIVDSTNMLQSKVAFSNATGTKNLVDEAKSPTGKATKVRLSANTSTILFYLANGKNLADQTNKTLLAGEIYTLSMMIRADTAFVGNGVTINEASIISHTFTQVTTEYKRVSVTFKPTVNSSTATNQNVHFYANDLVATVGNDIYIHSMKLEKGNIATAWTPAPEDTKLYTGWSNDPNGKDMIRVYPNENFVNISTMTLGKHMGWNGTALVSNVSRAVTGYIPVKKGSQYILTLNRDLGYALALHLFKNNDGSSAGLRLNGGNTSSSWDTPDSNGATFGTGKVTPVIPDGYNYVVISVIKNSDTVTMDIMKALQIKMELGTSATTYTPSPQDDPVKSEMGYIGYSPKDSNNPSDYVWSENPKAKGSFKRWSNDPNGIVDMTATYPNENLITRESLITHSTSTGNTVELGLYKTSIVSAGGTYLGYRTVGSQYNASTRYTMSFNFIVKSGTVERMGGHSTYMETIHYIKINGVELTNPTWISAMAYNFVVGQTYTIEVGFTTPATGMNGSSSDGIYIQPNRATFGKAYTADVLNLKIEEGSTPTIYTANQQDDKLLSVPQYVGIGSKDTMNPADFVWTLNSEYAKLSAVIESKVYTNAKIEIESEKISQEVTKVKDATEANKTLIEQTAGKWSANVSELKKYTSSFRQGKILYEDALFQDGFNGLKAYNNSGNGNVKITMTERSDSPTESESAVEVISTGAASPGFGGVYWGNPSRSGAIFVYRMIAKIPTGRNLAFGSNSTGTGAKHTWLTDFAGTGGWQEYLFMVECGTTGSFSTTGFFYVKDGVTPTAAAPLKWQICFGTVIDMTSFDTTVFDLKKDVEFKLTPDGIFGEISQSEEYSNWKDNMDDKPSRSDLDETNENVANLDSLLTDEDGIIKKVASMSLTADEFRTEIGEVRKTANDSAAVTKDVRSYMSFGKAGTLEIGKTDEEGMKVTLSNKTLTFYDKGTPVAYITGQTMKITEAEILDRIKVGRHEFSKLKEKPDITIVKWVG